MFSKSNGSNEYPQSMFWTKNKQNRYTQFYYTKVEFERGIHCMDCFPDMLKKAILHHMFFLNYGAGLE